MPDLTTERLLLRSPSPGDAEFFFDLYSRWDVQRFIGRVPRVMTDPAEARALAERYAGLGDPVFGPWTMTETVTGHRVGVFHLKPILASGLQLPLRASDDVEIGWHLHPDAWGRGYATEAGRTVLDHAFASGLGKVVAVTHKDNIASRNVATRIGMTHRGSTDAYYNTECELFVIERT